MISSTYVLFNNIAFLTGLYRSFKTARLALIKNHQILMENATRYAQELEMEKNNNISTDDEEDGFDPYGMELDPRFLEKAYDAHKKEMKQKKSVLNKIMSKKKFFREPKQPNMLTWNEREHIKFLHNQDPVEWNAEKLSESFPALPGAIKKILKNKWKPHNMERIKAKDKKVLENWEKLKRNELDAKPEVIEHMKKFIDKRENLKVQLENPKFFYLPEIKKKDTWNNGEMNTLLLKYEREIEMLKKKQLLQSNPHLLNDKPKKESAVAIVAPKDMEIKAQKAENVINNEHTIKEIIEMEKNIQKITEEEDSFVIGRKLKQNKEQFTLDSLKKEILEKSEKTEENLSVLEKTIIYGNTEESSSIPSEGAISVLNNGENEKNNSHAIQNGNEKRNKLFVREVMKILSRKSSEGKKNASDDVTIQKDMKKVKNNISTIGNASKNDINDLDDTGIKRVTVVNEANVQKLFDKKEITETVAEGNEKTEAIISQPKQEKKSVQYWNTEKDRSFYSAAEKDLSETSFWSEGKMRTKSKDSGLVLNRNNMSHIAVEDIYFDYNYPERIEIPKDKQGQGLTFRFRDCYYDEDGWFLYRVPGMTN